MALVPFYYYTNEAGLQEIKMFGYIKTTPLLGIDASYGEEGVYGTPLPPTLCGDVNSLNHCGPYWQTGFDGQLDIDRCIQIALPAGQVVPARSNPGILINLAPIHLEGQFWQVLSMGEAPAPNPSSRRNTYVEVVVETDTSASESSSDNDEDSGKE